MRLNVPSFTNTTEFPEFYAPGKFHTCAAECFWQTLPSLSFFINKASVVRTLNHSKIVWIMETGHASLEGCFWSCDSKSSLQEVLLCNSNRLDFPPCLPVILKANKLKL